MPARKPTRKTAAPPASPAPDPTIVPSLATYYLLGRSGLRVSPLCLGTMTFGKEWGWGNTERESEAIYNAYLHAGGNFIDTANFYTKGTSETYIGRFMRKSRNRDRIVLATKYTLNMHSGDPNAGGNGRKNMITACEESLRRLGTDYIDLYWMHMHDGMTPVEEVVLGLDALVRSGKVRYVGFSDVPSWYAARAYTIAEHLGLARVAALQLEYSLSVRDIEREHVQLAQELGLGITPWSPLAGGLLSGKYSREVTGDQKKYGGKGRLTFNPGEHPRFQNERNWNIVRALAEVAAEVGQPEAAVALNWITRRPGVVSTIIGATRPEQLAVNLRALEFELPADAHRKLDEASAFQKGFPYEFLAEGGFVQNMVRGGATIKPLPPWYRG